MYGIITNVSIWLPQGDSSTCPVVKPTINKYEIFFINPNFKKIYIKSYLKKIYIKSYLTTFR